MEVLKIRDEKSRKKGYSLLEMVLVIALLSIILSIIVFSFRAVRKMDAHVGVHELVDKLQECRSRALVEKKEVRVSIRFPSNSLKITSTGKQEFFELNPSLSFSSLHPHHLLKFLPNGSVYNATTLSLKDEDENSYIITISPVTGKITLKK